MMRSPNPAPRRRRLWGSGLLVLLAAVAGPSAWQHAPATAAPDRPAAPHTPASSYYLHGDVTNPPGTSTTWFDTTGYAADGSWQFSTQAAGGTALQGYCPSGLDDLDCQGVYGKALGASSRGVFGSSSNGVGVYGFSTNGVGVYAESFGGAAVRAKNTTAGEYAIIADGNVTVIGNLQTTGGIAAPVTTQQGARLVYADHATQNIFSDRGTATLKAGHAVVAIDPLYVQMVNLPRGYEVYVTPNTLRTPGLSVVRKTATSFEVGELNGGTGTFSFDWRIEAEALHKSNEPDRLNPAPALPAAPEPPTK